MLPATKLKSTQRTSLFFVLFFGLCLLFNNLYASELQDTFVNPPSSARPWVYWFWVNGNITKEGITADLEAMHKVGIGGTLIMHVGAGIPAGPIKFFSQEWQDLFKYAVTEAKRLGIEVTMNACDGWTGTGGPWIKPEEAMMQLTWTEEYISGPTDSPITLRQPKSKFNVYHDIAVLAFPMPAETAVQELKPIITSNDEKTALGKLNDGNIETSVDFDSTKQSTWIRFEYAKPFTARAIQFGFKTHKSSVSGLIECSQDGQTFEEICKFNLKQMSDISTITLSFDETTAKFFRIILPPMPSTFSEVKLLSGARINNWELKAGFARIWGHGADMPVFSMPKSTSDPQSSKQDPSWADKEPLIVDAAQIQDLSKNLDASGKLNWKAPQGKWVILRVGYTPTGELNGPASVEGTGLEPDALNPAGIDAAFSRFMGVLLKDVGDEAKDTLRYCHIDSWETGTQNWTANFRQEFNKRRGYDLISYLPVMAGGRVVDSVSVSERFLWDIRRTIADMIAEYYYGRMRDVCHQNGIKFQTEAAGASQFLFDPITFQSRSDFPMGEFWVTEARIRPDCKAAASAANIFGKKFVGAEAFTSSPSTSRWSEHPYSLKALGDEAFCTGVNRFVFHRYAMQPWLDVQPGMTMGKWGIHFERTNTWWQQGIAWMSYLARCQSLLQQGLLAADVLYFTGEGVPNYIAGNRAEINPLLPLGYDFDACNADVLLNMVTVKNGRLLLPNGMEYRLLLLADNKAMSLQLLNKIQKLVEDGAVVVGPKPVSAPGLTDYPASDKQVQKIADALWGTDTSNNVDRKIGSGRVLWGISFEEIFSKLDLAADFTYNLNDNALRYIHRREGKTDWYFISNQTYAPIETTCAFRVSDRQPQLWNPETGAISEPAVFRQTDTQTLLPLRLEPAGSVFVVFGPDSSGTSFDSVNFNDKEILSTKLSPTVAFTEHKQKVAMPEFGVRSPVLYPQVNNSFTISFWAKPLKPIHLAAQADQGITDSTSQQFISSPLQGELTYGPGHATVGISMGTNGICVFEHSSSYFPARIVYKANLKEWTHVALVYEQNSPSLYVDGKKVASAPKSNYIVHPAGEQRAVSSYVVAVRDIRIVSGSLPAVEIAQMTKSGKNAFADAPALEVLKNENGKITANVWKPGTFTLKSADSEKVEFTVNSIPEPFTVSGPWQVDFPGDTGTSKQITFEKLISWTEHSDKLVKYFSGTASYTKTIDVPDSAFGKDRRLYLDLGNVQVIAAVKVNDKDLGIIWKSPYMVDVTSALKSGKNVLEVEVTNLWTNRLIGDEQFPADVKYDNGRLVGWPQWFLKKEPRPQAQRLTFATWKHYDKNDPLLESGLLGPVSIKSAVVVSKDMPAK